MDEQLRSPRDSDRNAVRDRIKRAVAEGRITSADGDIRLSNVGSAHSMAELDLIARDLDQLDALGGGASTPASPSVTWTTGPSTTVGPAGATGAAGSGRTTLPLVIGAALLVMAAVGAVAFFVLSGGDDSSSGSTSVDLPSALPVSESPVASPGVPPGEDVDVEEPDEPEEPVGAAFVLSADGIRDFLGTYRAKFGTTRAVDITFYPDYVVMNVPVPGKNRHSGWLYRGGAFTDFGGVTANFPGAAPVDLARLDVDALMRNVGKARRTLEVEDPTTTYVIVNYRPDFDEEPNVNIYVSNEFRESGYLATHLDGTFERAFPYSG